MFYFLCLKLFFLTAILLPHFGLLSRGQPHSPDVNHCVLHFRPEGHREPRSEVGSLSPAECLVEFEPGTFRFLLQRFNPLGHSPPPKKKKVRMQQEIHQPNVCKTITVLCSISLYSSHYWIKVFPDASCYITGNLIRHNLNYFVFEYRGSWTCFAFVSSNPLIAECLSHEFSVFV